MSQIKSKDTKAEMILRRKLWKKGLRYRVHCSTIDGKPDIVFIRQKIAIFVDGCFWHKCPQCYRRPKSNKDYQLPKIDNNAKRDKKINKDLKNSGWKVIRIWEHEVLKNPDDVVNRIFEKIKTTRC